jgi:hypothetical protein
MVSKYGDPPLNGLIDDGPPRYLLAEDYRNLDGLSHTPRAAVIDLLDTAGYVRYDENTATHLRALAGLLKQKYGRRSTKTVCGEAGRSLISVGSIGGNQGILGKSSPRLSRATERETAFQPGYKKSKE